VDTAIAPANGEGPGPPLQVLGRYCLLERLGSGGFGEVFRAHDELLRREVAVKRIPCEADGIGERAAREAHAAARLSHPAIVALYEAAQEDGCFYLTSELVEGQTLARLVAQDALSDQEILQIGRALCDALMHAHGRGVIHRDVKPQNILVPDEPADRAGVAKLTDFGGARLDGEAALTATGDVLGTLAYMAPEQSEGRQAGPQADLYSLALVLYEALCGENPVRAATPAATVRKIGSELTPLGHWRSDLPDTLTDAIDCALLPDPEDRGDLAELASALEQALRGEAATVRTRSARPQPAEVPRTQLARVRPSATARTQLAPAAAPDPTPRRLTPRLPSLPRLIWAVAALALIAWQAAAGRPGLSLLLFAAALPLLIAMPSRASVAWLIPALAPLLGLLGIAAAFPASAGLPASPRVRACLGALGFWWLCLAQVGFTRGLAPAIGFSSGFPSANDGSTWARPGWEASLNASAHAIAPLLSLPTLAAAALWALGAALAPWLIRGRGVALDLLLAGIWSAALLAGPSLLAGVLQAGSTPAAAPAGAIIGAILGALALVMSASRVDRPYGGHAAESPHA
jgi:serine/threonine protein kinase